MNPGVGYYEYFLALGSVSSPGVSLSSSSVYFRNTEQDNVKKYRKKQYVNNKTCGPRVRKAATALTTAHIAKT